MANPNLASPGGMTNDEKAAVAVLTVQDINKGAAVHVGLFAWFIKRKKLICDQSFDPDATPEQKAAEAGKAKDQLAALPGTHLKHENKALSGRGKGLLHFFARFAALPC